MDLNPTQQTFQMDHSFCFNYLILFLHFITPVSCVSVGDTVKQYRIHRMAARPAFVLDELKHTDPMPGPVWRDRSFAGLFGYDIALTPFGP
jgi:hypothetical protein